MRKDRQNKVKNAGVGSLYDRYTVGGDLYNIKN